MVEHLVLFRWKAGVDSAAIESALEGLRALKEQIPGILELTCGPNFSERAKGFDAGLYVRFVSRSALDSYGPHPAHQRVVNELLTPIREDVIALDFES